MRCNRIHSREFQSKRTEEESQQKEQACRLHSIAHRNEGSRLVGNKFMYYELRVLSSVVLKFVDFGLGFSPIPILPMK